MSAFYIPNLTKTTCMRIQMISVGAKEIIAAEEEV
jgi:hypothetical protein